MPAFKPREEPPKIPDKAAGEHGWEAYLNKSAVWVKNLLTGQYGGKVRERVEAYNKYTKSIINAKYKDRLEATKPMLDKAVAEAFGGIKSSDVLRIDPVSGRLEFEGKTSADIVEARLLKSRWNSLKEIVEHPEDLVKSDADAAARAKAGEHAGTIGKDFMKKLNSFTDHLSDIFPESKKLNRGTKKRSKRQITK